MKKLALVAGATSGIGRAYAMLLAYKGWDLIITGRREEKLKSLSIEIQELGRSCEVIITDFNNADSFYNFLQIIKDKKIGFLVNCVGFSNHVDFFSSDFHKLHKMIEAHISCMAETIHTVVPEMKSLGGGTIINVSSLAGFLPSLSDPFYSGSKSFINTYSESINLILSRDNITVQSLCPGYTHTDFHKDMNLPNKAFKNRGLKRWAKPEDVVKYSYKKIHKNRVVVIPGISNRIVYNVIRFLPKKLYYKMAGKKRALDEK